MHYENDNSIVGGIADNLQNWIHKLFFFFGKNYSYKTMKLKFSNLYTFSYCKKILSLF